MRIRLSRPNAIFWALYLVVLLWCYHNSSDDPGSAFYRPHEAFSSSHSRQREAEVDAYIGKVAASTVPITTTASAQMNEYLCIGIPSVNRTRPDFLARTLGSLTDTLSPAERAGVHIVVLLADRAPQLHTAYGQPWLSRLADDVLVYDSDGIDLSELPAKSDPTTPTGSSSGTCSAGAGATTERRTYASTTPSSSTRVGSARVTPTSPSSRMM